MFERRTYDPERHQRRSIRLKGYDYTRAGAYFVTLCTRERECSLGQIEDGIVILSEYGRLVERCWRDLPRHSPRVALDVFVVMPNHVHGVIWIVDIGRGTACRAPTVERLGQPIPHSLPTIIRSFKSAVTKRINGLRATPSLPVWQRNYYERVIRDDDEWQRIREYIQMNPARWEEDENHPRNIRSHTSMQLQDTPWAIHESFWGEKPREQSEKTGIP